MLGLYAFSSVPYSTRPPEIREGVAQLFGSGELNVLSSEVLQGSTARVEATASVTCNAVRVRTPVLGAINGQGFMVSNAIRSPANLSTRMNAVASFTADSYRKGQEWSTVAPGNESWTNIPNP